MRRITVAAAVCLAALMSVAGCAKDHTVLADSLTFKASNEWIRQVPAQESRKLQFTVPSAIEGVGDAELVVWNVAQQRDAGDGRLIRKHFEHWREQVVQADGTPAPAADVTEYRINGLPVYVSDMAGRYVGEFARGGDLRHNRPYSRLVVAYIVAPQGDYIVRMLGPVPTVNHNMDRFKRFLTSARPFDFTDVEIAPQTDVQPQATLTATRGGL